MLAEAEGVKMSHEGRGRRVERVPVQQQSAGLRGARGSAGQRVCVAVARQRCNGGDGEVCAALSARERGRGARCAW